MVSGRGGCGRCECVWRVLRCVLWNLQVLGAFNRGSEKGRQKFGGRPRAEATCHLQHGFGAAKQTPITEASSKSKLLGESYKRMHDHKKTGLILSTMVPPLPCGCQCRSV